MTLTTVADVRPLVPSPLIDSDLQAVIARIEDGLVRRLGSLPDGTTTVTETLRGDSDCNLFVKRPVASLSSVVEYIRVNSNTGTTLTSGDDFYLWENQGRLERANGQKWGDKIVVTYVPVANASEWKAVVIDLVRLYHSRTGLKAESIVGSHSYQSPPNWDKEIIAASKRLRFVAG